MTAEASMLGFLRGLALDFLPVLSVALLVLVTTIPTSLPPMTTIGGIWPLIGIAYWTLSRPGSMPVTVVFLLGLLTDIVTFVPFGLHGFVFVLARMTLIRQRRFLMGQGFWVLWVAYALLAAGVYTLLFLLTSLFQPGAVSYAAGLVGVSIAWACVPLVIWFLSRLHDMINLFDEPIA
ncbi:MAG: mreD [Alphaproteobacteria bacterium]|nr:mreD [Alphaproteobacteria bacterium]